MNRTISSFGLFLTSISAIIGSGWLFSAFYSASIAGPGAILSWLIGGFFILIVAFVFAEICGMLPVSGSSARIPQYTHGMTVSFMFAWMIWLSYLALMAAEVQAVIQYSSFYFPYLTHQNGGLTHHGYVAAVVLMFLVSFINTYSIRWLIRCNSFLTILKIIIPFTVVIFILSRYFSFSNVIHPVGSQFLPTGIAGVLGAISSGGIVFAFNGFKQAAEMAGEAKNPERAVPIAIIGSIVVCLILFLLIQFSFLSSLTSSNLINGWAHIQLVDNNSPLASVIQQDHMHSLLPLLYIGAIIAPLAAGLMYCSSAARSLYGMSKNGYLPSFFQKLSPLGNPINSTMVNFVLGLCLFAPLPGWNSIVDFLTSMLAITYAAGPICMLALRSQAPNQKRFFKLPMPKTWAFAAFYICTLLAYWSGFAVLDKMVIAVMLGMALLIIYRLCSKHNVALHLKESMWIWPYFLGIIFFSYFGEYGGKAVLNNETCYIGIAIFCLFIMWLGHRYKLSAAETQQYIHDLHLERNETQ